MALFGLEFVIIGGLVAYGLSKSVEHAKQCEPDACIYCWQNRRQNKHTRFCSKQCAELAYSGAPHLVHIPMHHEAFSDIAGQFRTDWERIGTTCPKIERIFKIFDSEQSKRSYEAYAAKVGNVQRYWHGTVRECKLGKADDRNGLCNSSTCSLCQIIRNSLNLSYSGQRFLGRFGRGIYTSRVSSTSDIYSKNSTQPHKKLKALLLNKVAVGKPFTVAGDRKDVQCPPAGYDSVVSNNVMFTRHECVVYNNDAIRPSWLVMYTI